MARHKGDLGGVIVVSRSDLSDLPAAEERSGYSVRVMDTERSEDVAAWLAVHNDAFDHGWTEPDFTRSVLENPVLDVIETYLVERAGSVVAVGSAAAFRRNPTVGAGHWIAVHSTAQGTGVGRMLALHRFHALRARGFTAAESQTNVDRVASLRMHWDCGFRPKYRLDPWNSGRDVDALTRVLVNRRLRSTFRQWERSRGLR